MNKLSEWLFKSKLHLVGVYFVVMLGLLVLREGYLPSGWSPVYGVLFITAVYLGSPIAILMFGLPFLFQDLVNSFTQDYFRWSGLAVTLCGYSGILTFSTLVRMRSKVSLQLLASAGAGAWFYAVSSTGAFLLDPFYVKSLEGWIQCLLIGHPEVVPSAFYFLRGTLFSSLLFGAVFIGLYKILTVLVCIGLRNANLKYSSSTGQTEVP